MERNEKVNKNEKKRGMHVENVDAWTSLWREEMWGEESLRKR